MANFTVTITGDGHALRRLVVLAHELQLRELAHFTEHMNSTELLPRPAHFHVFLLSSRPIPGSNWVET
jgi:hypothetical protein